MSPIVDRRAFLAAAAATAAAAPLGARAQSDDALEITIRGGEFRPIALAMPPFVAADAESRAAARNLRDVAQADLVNSALFRSMPDAALVSSEIDIDAAPDFTLWRASGADALLVARAMAEPDGRRRVEFRLFDVPTGRQLEGVRFFVDPAAERRVAHKIADAVYTALTGEGAYFDSRIAFVDERGPKNNRAKRLALMDQDGANFRHLTGPDHLALTPRFSPTDQEVLYVSYETGQPQVFIYEIDTGRREALGRFSAMSFAPRFSPDGRSVALSSIEAGDTDILLIDLATRSSRRLTRAPGIETAPSFSPDGARMAFESDRGGGQQLYVMDVSSGDSSARRISYGDGRYSTPVWSPRGDLIAFTRQRGGGFDIGVMAPDGSGERILDSAFHAEGPSWAPNGRVLSFFKETPGERGASAIWTVDIAGLAARRLPTPAGASDPAWSPLLG